MTHPPGRLVLTIPLRGPCRVENSPADRVPSHGTDLFGSSHAIDLVPVGADGRSGPAGRRPLLRTESPEDFAGFGRPVLAPVAGEVVIAHDGEPDGAARRAPLRRIPYVLGQGGRVRRGAAALAGNHVVIRIGPDGPYVLLAHLLNGSLRVTRGAAVSADEPVARCGNSGNSTEPHLHLQVTDSVEWARARAVPFAFARPGGDAWLPGSSDVVQR